MLMNPLQANEISKLENINIGHTFPIKMDLPTKTKGYGLDALALWFATHASSISTSFTA